MGDSETAESAPETVEVSEGGGGGGGGLAAPGTGGSSDVDAGSSSSDSDSGQGSSSAGIRENTRSVSRMATFRRMVASPVLLDGMLEPMPMPSQRNIAAAHSGRSSSTAGESEGLMVTAMASESMYRQRSYRRTGQHLDSVPSQSSFKSLGGEQEASSTAALEGAGPRCPSEDKLKLPWMLIVQLLCMWGAYIGLQVRRDFLFQHLVV